jgi:hypothetical protein
LLPRLNHHSFCKVLGVTSTTRYSELKTTSLTVFAFYLFGGSGVGAGKVLYEVKIGATAVRRDHGEHLGALGCFKYFKS